MINQQKLPSIRGRWRIVYMRLGLMCVGLKRYVGLCFLGVTVFLRTSKLCMAAIREVTMTGIRFVSVCV